MNKQHFPIRYALLLAGMTWLPMLANGNYMDKQGKVDMLLYRPTHSGWVVPNIPFLFAEKMPQFPGGSTAMQAYIWKQTRYPIDAKGEKGKVLVQFTVDTVGPLRDIKVVRSVSPALDAEAMRIVSSMPAWIPGKQDGHPVFVQYSLPIDIKPICFHNEADIAPKFPGGDEGLAQYLRTNILYPVEAEENGEQGRVMVGFTITNEGAVEDVHVIKGVSPSIDRETIRAFRNMPVWSPGQLSGKTIHVKCLLPITFSLQ